MPTNSPAPTTSTYVAAGHGAADETPGAERVLASAAMRLLAPLVILCAVGCYKVDTPRFTETIDAGGVDAQTSFVIGGSLTGLWTGAEISVRLVATGVDEILSANEDGAFSFSASLPDEAPYTVTIEMQPEQHTCSIEAGNGVVSGADVESVVVRCIGPAVDVELTAPIAWDFDPSLASQNADVSVVVQSAQFIVTAPGATSIELDDAALASGVPSSTYSFALGANVHVIDVEIGALSKAYTIVVDRGADIIEQYVYGKQSNTGTTDRFGHSVSLDGDRLAVGAYQEDSSATGIGGSQFDEGAPDSGAVYVFRRSGVAWIQEAYIKAPNADAGDLFGYSVSLSGTALAVGAQNEDSNAVGINGDQSNDLGGDTGAVYVYRRSGTTWTFEAYIKASNPGTDDEFGRAISFSGETLAIAAPFEDASVTGINGTGPDNTPNSGAVYVFRRSLGAWAQQAYIKASTLGISEQFGFSVSLDVDSLAVGAPFEDSDAVGINGNQGNDSAMDSGAVFLFRRNGSIWAQEAYVKASNAEGLDYFGIHVAIRGDVLAVGAVGEDGGSTGVGGNQSDNSALQSGAVYLLRRVGTAWLHDEYVKASNTGTTDGFGACVALGDGVVAVAAAAEDGASTGVGGTRSDDGAPGAGAVYVFRDDGVGWAQDAYVKASNTDSGDTFGCAMDFSVDGLVIAAKEEASSSLGLNGSQDDDGAVGSGAIYIYR